MAGPTILALFPTRMSTVPRPCATRFFRTRFSPMAFRWSATSSSAFNLLAAPPAVAQRNAAAASAILLSLLLPPIDPSEGDWRKVRPEASAESLFLRSDSEI